MKRFILFLVLITSAMLSFGKDSITGNSGRNTDTGMEANIAKRNEWKKVKSEESAQKKAKWEARQAEKKDRIAERDEKSYRQLEFSFATISMELNGEMTYKSNKPFYGGRIGILYGHSISNSIPLYIESGVSTTFAIRDIEYDDDYSNLSVKEKGKIQDIAVPVNLTCRYYLSENVAIVPLIGLNLKVTYWTKDQEFYRNKDEYSENDMRFNVGMNAGIGLNIDRLHIGYRFQPDLIEFSKGIKTQSNFFTVGLIF